MRRRALWAVALACVWLSMCAVEAAACSCFANAPPCQAVGAASAVFVGAVTAAEPPPKIYSDDGRSYHLGERAIAFSVEQPFRGVGGATEVKIYTGSGGGDCGYTFTVGARYIVYAHLNEKDGRLRTSICTRTRLAAEAAEDFEYLNGLAAAQPGALIYGEVRRFVGGANSGESRDEPLGGVQLVVEGKGLRVEARTDAQGRYRVPSVPPGDYTVTPSLPEELATHGPARKVTVVDKGCAAVGYMVHDNGRVSGKVTDADGAPVPKILVELIDADAAESDNPRRVSAEADGEGRFAFKLVPPGRYLLGVRLSSSPLPDSAAAAFRRTYFPGVSEPEQATVIVIGAGESAAGRDLRLPPRLREAPLTGTVVLSDGSPAANARIVFYETTHGGSPTGLGAEADAQGRFTLKTFEGLRYLVGAHINMSNGGQAHAEPTEVVAGADARDIRLIITEPDGSCARCRALTLGRPKRARP